jgi:hypothetical protein
VAEVVGLVRIKYMWVYGEEEEKMVFEGLGEVVEAELQHIDSVVEDAFDTKCVEANVIDYNTMFKITFKDRIGGVEATREFYVPKTNIEIVVIPVKAVIREVDGDTLEATMAKAQYFMDMVNGGCYKYHIVDLDELLDLSKAIIRETFLEEAKEVEEGGGKSG